MPGMENVFRSSRLLYRAIEDTQSDEDFMHSIQTDSDAYAMSNSDLLAPQSRKATKEFRDQITKQRLLSVVICLAPTEEAAPDAKPEPVGCLILQPLKPEQACHRHTYISIDIVKGHQRKGYGSEAIHWALDWAFKIAGLHRVAIEAGSYNTGAAELYERLGFVYEGRQRQIYWFNGGWYDLITYALLEDEWRELRKQGKWVNEFAT